MTTYDVRYKGRTEHRSLKAHELVELVRSGQVSGVHSYCVNGDQQWHPVFRMEYQRDSEGRWEIVDAGQAARAPEPDAKTIPVAATPSTPQVASPSVVIYQQAPGTPASPAPDPAAGSTPHKGGGLSIAGFTVAMVSMLAMSALLVPELFRVPSMIAGAILSVAGIVLSSCGMPKRRLRALAIAGLALSVLTLFAWGVFIAYLATRPLPSHTASD